MAEILLSGFREQKPLYVGRVFQEDFKTSFINLWRKMHDISDLPVSDLQWIYKRLGDITVQVRTPTVCENLFPSIQIQKTTKDNSGTDSVRISCPFVNNYRRPLESAPPPIVIERLVTKGNKSSREIGIIMPDTTCATIFSNNVQMPVIRDYMSLLNNIFKRKEDPKKIQTLSSAYFINGPFLNIKDVVETAKKYKSAMEVAQNLFT